jgi:hypothetical protein
VSCWTVFVACCFDDGTADAGLKRLFRRQPFDAYMPVDEVIADGGLRTGVDDER